MPWRSLKTSLTSVFGACATVNAQRRWVVAPSLLTLPFAKNLTLISSPLSSPPLSPLRSALWLSSGCMPMLQAPPDALSLGSWLASARTSSLTPNISTTARWKSAPTSTSALVLSCTSKLFKEFLCLRSPWAHSSEEGSVWGPYNNIHDVSRH